MSNAMTNPDLRRKIKVRMRPDLTIKEQRYHGQTFFVVKDPVTLRYYRFREEELFLLRQFDGEKNLDDVRHEFVERFRPQRISVQELEKFVGQLLQAGIATVDTPQLGRRLYQRYRKRQRDKIRQTAMNFMYLKVPIFDPERLLERLMPVFGLIFTIPFFLCAVALMSSAALLVAVNWDTFLSKLPNYHEFFTWRNLLYFWATLAVVKVLHEFGHGISCKKFGGEVHEMGFLFLVFTPCLYCNVTDAWMLRNKWHRVVIGAAGIYVELILSAIFTWVWWYSEPGLLNTLSLSIVFICSVSTVVFNGNPLLRFDGYYILADFLEIPNLRERANKFLGNLASKFFFGAEAAPDPFLPKQRQWFFVLYALLSYLYRWVVLAGILWFFYTLLEPYKLVVVSQLLGLLAAFTMLVMPAWKTYGTLRNRWRQMKVKTSRMVASFSFAAALLLLLAFTPLPMRVDVPMIVQPKDVANVFVLVPGILAEGELRVKDHDIVGKGALLARLSSPQHELQLRQLLGEKDQLESSMGAVAFSDPRRAQELHSRHAATVGQLEALQAEMARLEIRAPRSGMVFLPPKQRDLGKTFSPGQLFCQVGDPTELEAYMVVAHSDISLVEMQPHIHQRVWLKLSGHVGSILEARVGNVTKAALETVPPALSNKYGGEVATTTDQERQQETPLLKSYGVQAPLPNLDGALTPGVRGLARIDCGYKSLFWRCKRYFQQTFSLSI